MSLLMLPCHFPLQTWDSWGEAKHDKSIDRKETHIKALSLTILMLGIVWVWYYLPDLK